MTDGLCEGWQQVCDLSKIVGRYLCRVSARHEYVVVVDSVALALSASPLDHGAYGFHLRAAPRQEVRC